ncbi:hypothetical protein HYX10_06570 [Candidatus Woesearchaeota archaeon]|nr:hypothetical protein [Candidatus Woesearchaeota archaeon]
MADIVLIAIIGLLLLIPVEILFLLVIAASRRQEPSKITIAEQTPPERYGWEDYLKLPAEKKRAPGRAAALVVLIVFAALALLPLAFFTKLALPADVFNITDKNISDSIQPGLNVSGQQLNASVLPSLNITLPALNLSVVPRLASLKQKAVGYKDYSLAVVAAVIVIAMLLAAFMYFVRRRRHAVIAKAGKTADKLIRKEYGEKAELMKKPAKEKAADNQVRGEMPIAKSSALSRLRHYFAPLATLIVLVLLAALIYIFREKITAELAGIAAGYLAKIKSFGLRYRWYVVGGVAAAAAVIAALQRFKKK